VVGASAVDGLGDGALAAAMPLLTASLTHDPRIVSLVAAAAYLPWLLISLPAGAIIDRANHARVMWISQLGQAVVVATLAVVIAAGAASAPLVIGAAFLVGIGEVMFGNASQSILPSVVRAEQLPRANGRLYIVQTISQSFAGPPLGSVLFVAAAALPFGLDAATFAASAALIMTIPRRLDAVPAPRISLRRSIAEGLRYLAAHRLLRTLAVVLGLNNLAGTLGTATVVLFATQTLGMSEQLFGTLFLGSAVGAVIGGLVAPTVVRLLGELPSIIVGAAIMAAPYLSAAFVTDGFQLAALLAVTGFAVILWNVVTVSLRQRVVPPELLGRVNSVYKMIGWGLIPVGAVLGGWVAATWGLRAPLPVAGGIRIVVLLVALPSLVGGMRALRDARANLDTQQP
jgi:MFS family permease